MTISIVTPAWPYRGGIAVFSERLAHQLQSWGHKVNIYNYTLQYPSPLFPGKTQYSVEPAPSDLTISRRLSSVNPLTWVSLGRQIKREQPDLLILPYWMPFFAPCLGTVGRLARRNGHTRVILLCHNLLPHERRIGDVPLTRWLIHSIDAVIALSQNVCDIVHSFIPKMPTVASPHPIYDSFGATVSHDEACAHLHLDPSQHYFLFFGLIRDYKGLDWLIEAYARQQNDFKLVIAGEFYSGKERYHALAKQLGIEDKIIWRTEFVPDSEVRYYFGAADLLVQPYKTATQSGVTQIAFHFEVPMLVTRVGGLPEIVPDGKVGYVTEANPEAIAEAMQRFATEHPDFSAGLADEKKKYSWEVFTGKMLSLLDEL